MTKKLLPEVGSKGHTNRENMGCGPSKSGAAAGKGSQQQSEALTKFKEYDANGNGVIDQVRVPPNGLGQSLMTLF